MSDAIRSLSWLDEKRAGRQPFYRRECVYFIAAGDMDTDGTPVKIGWTRLDPHQRLSSIQSHHYLELSLVATIPGSLALEGYFHGLLAADRIRGEWFRSSVALRNLIASADNEMGRVA